MKRVSAGLCLLFLLGCQRQPHAPVRPEAAPAAAPEAAPAAGDAPESPMGQVTGHRWWAVEVQPDDVEKILYCVQAQGAGALVLVDRQCRVSVVNDREAVALFRADRRVRGQDLPDRVFFDLGDYKARPGWLQLLRDLKGRLDRADLLAHPDGLAGWPR
jgi:hypothetical protein